MALTRTCRRTSRPTLWALTVLVLSVRRLRLQRSRYDDVKDTDTQTITSSSWTPNVGDVFTIGVVGTGVHDVNPVTKARLPFLKQFRVVSGSSNTWVISPALIWNGAFQNMESVGQTDLNSLAITAVGTNCHCLHAEHALPPQCLRSRVCADGEACWCG